LQHSPRGGSSRISNLTLACHDCNQTKGKKTAEEFKHPEVQEKAKKPLKDAAMMNATRWQLFTRLKETGLPVECGTGARTKKQRIEHGLHKEHYYDACCVGASTPDDLVIALQYVQVWTAVGRGSRKMCNTDKHGFSKSHRSKNKLYFGFQTGNIVVANVLRGKYKGQWVGRVAVRASGYFDIKDGSGKRMCQGIYWRHMRILQRNCGWQYERKGIAG